MPLTSGLPRCPPFSSSWALSLHQIAHALHAAIGLDSYCQVPSGYWRSPAYRLLSVRQLAPVKRPSENKREGEGRTDGGEEIWPLSLPPRLLICIENCTYS